MRTTANLNYRLYIPWGWIAIKYCHLEFFGDDIEVLKRKWDDIKYDKFDYWNEQIKRTEGEIKELENEISKYSLSESIIIKRREYKNKERDLKFKRVALRGHELNRWYSASELKHKAQRFLKDNDFVLISKNSSGSECRDTYEVYERIKK